MREDLKDKYGKLFETYEERKKVTAQKQENIKSEQDLFLEAFYSIRASIIKPVFDEVGKLIETKGHAYKIEQNDWQIDLKGKTKDAIISIIFYLGAKHPYSVRSHDCPSISFIGNRVSQKVLLHGSTMIPNYGGSSGGRGEFKLEDITTKLVEDETFQLLNEVFKRF